MKAGYAPELRRRVARPDGQARLYAEALAVKGEVIKSRRTEWDAGTKSNVETFDDGAVRLTGSATAQATHAASDSYSTDLNEAKPLDILAWELTPSIGAQPRLSKVDVFLNRRFNGGQPAFDGDFTVQIYAVRWHGQLIQLGLPAEFWYPVPVTDPVRVAATELTADTQLVSFLFDGLAGRPPALVIGEDFIPQMPAFNTLDLRTGLGANKPLDPMTGRVIVVLVRASGGSNTNYGLGRDSTQATTKASAGTLRHRIANAGVGVLLNYWKMTDTAIGMTRATLYLGGYPASGSVSFTGGSKLDLGASVQGTIEFRVRGEAPAGTTLVGSARVNGGEAWVPVKDGQTPADVGLAVSQFYEMKAEFTSNASTDATPTLRELGFQDRTTLVLADAITDLCSLEGFAESIGDLLTGESLIAEGHCKIQRTGVRDFRDLATKLVSETDFSNIEVRTFVGHESLTRDLWLHLDTYRVDDFAPNPTEIDLLCVSPLERLLGTYPLPSGSLFGWFLKAATSDITAGTHVDDFNRELSEVAETAGTIAVSVAASATENSRGVTKAGVPNSAQWPTGNWTIKVNVTVANTNIQLSVAVARINSAGTEQQISAFSDEQQATAGVKIFALNNLKWAAGAVSDRIKIVYRFRNTAGSIQSVTIETGTINTEVVSPMTPIQSVTPAVYSQQALQTVFEDWRDVKIGLAARYRGRSPPSQDLVTKNVANADGKRELERLAAVGGGSLFTSQGRIHFGNLFRPMAAIVATFPLEEQANIQVTPGLRARIPDLIVGWGFDNGVRPNDFAAHYDFVHVAALSKFGASRIDNPRRELEKETAQWIPDAGLAQRIGEPIVQALGAGQIVWRFTSTIPHPELELFDPVAVECDSFAMKNPTTGEAIVGPIWGLGLVIEKGDLWGRQLGIWIRDYADLWAISRTPYRHGLFEPPVVEATIFSLPDQPQNATIRLRAYPATATIKYYVHADGTTAPDRDSPLWTLYGAAPFSIARSASADLLLSYFATDNGVVGPLKTDRIAPDQTAALLSLSGSQAGATPTIIVTVTANPNANVRRIRWYARIGNWPTTDGTQGAALSQTYFISDKSVYGNGGGFDATGNPVDGALTEAKGGVATGNHVFWIAVPLDYNGNPGPRTEFDYLESATVITVKPISLALNAAGTDCAGNKRKLDFSWTPNANVVDATHDLLVYKTQDGWRSLLFTEVSPKSVTTRTAVAVNAMASAIDPSRSDTYDFELKAGGTIVESGSVGTDTYNGHLCLF